MLGSSDTVCLFTFAFSQGYGLQVLGCTQVMAYMVLVTFSVLSGERAVQERWMGLILCFSEISKMR